MAIVKHFNLVGVSDTIQLGKAGLWLKTNGLALEIRTADDSGLTIFRALPGVSSNDVVTLSQLNAVVSNAASATYTNAALANVASLTLIAKSTADAAFDNSNTKADASFANAALSTKADGVYTNAALANAATMTFVNSAIAAATGAIDLANANSVINALPITHGGTGATTASQARSNLSASGVYRTTFTNANVSNGICVITHPLGQQFVSVTVTDNNNAVVLPDNIYMTNSTATSLDFTSFGTLTGTWRVTLIG